MASSSNRHIELDDQTRDQYHDDARLSAEFDESETSGKLFNYSRSVPALKTTSTEVQLVSYFEKIQRGGFIQSFGCLLVVDIFTFKIIALSENCLDMFGLRNEPMSLIGVDVRTLFTPSSVDSFAKAFRSREISSLNPIWVDSSANNRVFYAILHKIDVGVLIDLEPIHSGDPSAINDGTLESQKLVGKAISRLQSLPGGDIGVLCDNIVEDVQKLTGFDRVMVYKFHDDNHGEVISEIRRSDLEPYLGVHYPAADIPHVARFLFMQNRVRMIYDCRAQPVRIIQSEELKKPISLVGSTLRSPHGCHSQYMRNMGSIASLVMTLALNDDNEKKLWGLVVCHHTSPRYVPCPIRYACELLMQTFSSQLQIELQIVSQLREKNILRVQTLLSDMFLRDSFLGIVTQSPNIMDLVRCDGAALYYGGKCWLLGVTPSDEQLQNILEWLLKILGDSMGLFTDSLANAGYPALLGDAVCGMAAARIASSNFLFWFRSQIANDCKMGGAKHHLEEEDVSKMHPRTSFNTFLEVVKSRSQPWEATEINAIHSLQLIMRDSLQEIEQSGSKVGVFSQTSVGDDAQR